MRQPTIDQINEVLPGKHRSSFTKAVKALNEAGFTDGNGARITPQYLRLRLSSVDQSDDFDRASELVSSRNAKAKVFKLTKDVRELADALGTKDELLDGIADAVTLINEAPPVDYRPYLGDAAGRGMVVEALLSDLQIGKLTKEYNTNVAFKRLYEYGRALRFQIEKQIAAGYRVEKIVLALLGDIVESDKKHANSGRACDTSTAEQIRDAIFGLWTFVVKPLALLGIPMDVVAVGGNHDWDGHGIEQFRPGRNMLSYPLYEAIAMIAKEGGYENVNFVIPEGSYAIHEIYGQRVLYEHGVGVSVSEASMKSHKVKRTEQEANYITYFRMGDKHNVSTFNSGQYVVNGAFFGSDAGGTEYSGIAGFSSVAAQWVGFHLERADERLTLYDTFTIQLGHIKDDR